MTDIRTMNLGDAGDGMVPIDTKPKLEQPSVSFVRRKYDRKKCESTTRNYYGFHTDC